MDFKHIHINEELTIIKVSSNTLDTNNAPDLKSDLVFFVNQGLKHIIVDLSACEYIDSSGLSAILFANRICEDEEKCFVLAGLQPQVDSLIHLSMLHTVLKIADTVKEAQQLIENCSKF